MIHRLAAAAVAVVVASASPVLAADEPALLGLAGMEIAFLAALTLIALACLFVPLSRMLGLGTVIGYLVAGVVAGSALSTFGRLRSQIERVPLQPPTSQRKPG